VRGVDDLAAVLNPGVGEARGIARHQLEGAAELEIGHGAVGPDQECSRRPGSGGGLPGDGAVFDRPEFGVAIPAGQVFAVEDLLEADLAAVIQEDMVGLDFSGGQDGRGLARSRGRLGQYERAKQRRREGPGVRGEDGRGQKESNDSTFHDGGKLIKHRGMSTPERAWPGGARRGFSSPCGKNVRIRDARNAKLFYCVNEPS